MKLEPKKQVLLICLTAFALVDSNQNVTCGISKGPSGFIVRGQKISRGDFPWAVALLLSRHVPPAFFCGGTLISAVFVVSAAHCILEKNSNDLFLPREVIALFGAHDLSNPYENGRIAQSPKYIKLHEEWNPNTVRYDADISLLEFEKGSILFNDDSIYVRPICLWNEPTEPTEKIGIVTGWGKSEDQSKIHENKPRLAYAPIQTIESCVFESERVVDISSPRTFCAGSRNGTGVCHGDSGGGLYLKVDRVYYFRGIISSSINRYDTCDVTDFAVYTNVLKFKDWIEKNTKEEHGFSAQSETKYALPLPKNKPGTMPTRKPTSLGSGSNIDNRPSVSGYQTQTQYQAQPAYQYPQAYQTTRRTTLPAYRPPVYVSTHQFPPILPQTSSRFERFDETEQELNDPDFTTRPPVKNKPGTKPTRKPPSFTSGSRFSDRDDIRKLLKWDPVISNAMEGFALQLMYELNEAKLADTFMVSPYSIYHMLVLIAEGAKGITFIQLNESLGLQSMPRTRDFQQYLAMALNQTSAEINLKKFAMIITDAARPVLNDYEARIEKTYDASVERVWFQQEDKTLNQINGEVNRLTYGQINDAITREDLYKAKLILLTGLTFQGSWSHVFNTSFTKVEDFHDTHGTKTGEVNMMIQRGPFAYSAVAELGCQLIELSYAEATTSSRYEDVPTGTGLSMILALPKKGLEINDAMHKIYQHGMDKIYRELDGYSNVEVEVHLPRFEISTNFNLKTPLEEFGITDLFDQTRANLSNINDQYFVSAMIHKTRISVVENGKSPTATKASKSNLPKFHANKPFIFFIVDRVTRMILFSGQYDTPSLY